MSPQEGLPGVPILGCECSLFSSAYLAVFPNFVVNVDFFFYIIKKAISVKALIILRCSFIPGCLRLTSHKIVHNARQKLIPSSSLRHQGTLI